MTNNTTAQPAPQPATTNQLLDFLHQFPAELTGATVQQARTYDVAITSLRNALAIQENTIKALQKVVDEYSNKGDEEPIEMDKGEKTGGSLAERNRYC